MSTRGSCQSATVDVAIASQDMAAALRTFARQTRRQVAFDRAVVAGKRSRSVSGRMPPDVALARLLEGSGLAVDGGASGLFIIISAPRIQNVAVPTAPTEEIIVTARRFEERALDVPGALSAVRGRTLERRGIRSVSDALQEAVGVGVYDNGMGFAKVTIRGISTSLGGNENGFYLDDLPFTGVTVPISPDVRAWDIDRVEVLRGPQGTLFGEGSMGGTVRVLTNDADPNAWEAKGTSYVSATQGGGIDRGVKGTINAPIVSGLLALRVSGTAEHLPGWVDDAATGRRDVNDQDVNTLRARLRLDPSDRLTIDGSFWSYHRSARAGGARATDDGDLSRAQSLDGGLSYRLYGGSVRYDLGGVWANYSRSNLRATLPQSGPLLGDTLLATIDIDVTSQELRLESGRSGRFRWTAGAYLRDADRSDRIALPSFGIDNRSSTASRAQALFAEASYAFPSLPVDLTAGLRYFRERLDGSAEDAGVLNRSPGDTFHSFNPRFVAAVHPASDATIYVSAAKGFRPGQLQPTYSQALAAPLGIQLSSSVAQDTIWTYELGAKAELFGRALTLEGAVYHSDWRDVPVRIPIGSTGFNGLVNSEGTRTDGVELAASLRPVRNLSLSAGGSYIAARYAGPVAGTGIVAGAPVEDVARFTAYASADYRTRIARDRVAFGRLDWQHSSPRYSVAFPGYLPGDGIDQVAVRIGVEAGRTRVSLFVDNLTDDRGAVSFRTVQPLSSGIEDISAFRLRPRTIGFEIGLRLSDRDSDH